MVASMESKQKNYILHSSYTNSEISIGISKDADSKTFPFPRCLAELSCTVKAVQQHQRASPKV